MNVFKISSIGDTKIMLYMYAYRLTLFFSGFRRNSIQSVFSSTRSVPLNLSVTAESTFYYAAGIIQMCISKSFLLGVCFKACIFFSFAICHAFFFVNIISSVGKDMAFAKDIYEDQISKKV